ncbi:MAG: hypothetical protein JNK73_13145 [Bacteroidia bacterium]|nr:hypothetical protein [Bacteroidia bacterium]
MVEEQDWIEAYKEIGKLMEAIPEVKHVDLWHEQIDFLPEEYPWPPGSVFIEVNVSDTSSTGLKVQDLNAEVTVFFVLDTLADTYMKSATQDIAFEFGQVLKKIHKALHGNSGKNFSAMNRRGIFRQPAPQYLMAYKQVFNCIIRDMSAMDEPGEATLTKATVNTSSPPILPETPMYPLANE